MLQTRAFRYAEAYLPHPFCFHRQTKWSTCALSGQPLQAPVVADHLGSLYKREAVLEFLLARAGHFTDEAAEVIGSPHCIHEARDKT